MIVRNILSPLEVEMLRQHTDRLAMELEEYVSQDALGRKRVEDLYPTLGETAGIDLTQSKRPDLQQYPEIHLTDGHARK